MRKSFSGKTRRGMRRMYRKTKIAITAAVKFRKSKPARQRARAMHRLRELCKTYHAAREEWAASRWDRGLRDPVKKSLEEIRGFVRRYARNGNPEALWNIIKEERIPGIRARQKA